MAPFDKNVLTAELEEKVDPVKEPEVSEADHQRLAAEAERMRQAQMQPAQPPEQCYCGVGRASMLASPSPDRLA